MREELMERLAALVADVDRALAALGTVCEEERPEFKEARTAFVALEKAFTRKSLLDSYFAYIAQRESAGRYAGTTTAADYLVRELGISQQAAAGRVRAGNMLFGPPSEQTAGAADADKKNELKLQARSQPVAEEKARAITRELERLAPTAAESKEELLVSALAQAQERGVKDVAAWTRDAVTKANRAAKDADGRKDELVAHRNRTFWMKDQDEFGGVKFGGYLPAGMAAVLKAAMAPGRCAGSNTSVSEDEDNRTMNQRMADQFFAIVKGHSAERARNNGGAANLVITATLEDVNNLSPLTRFGTNVGFELRALDLLMAGNAGRDYALLTDGLTGVPLALGRSVRTATFEQKLALTAMEMCCSAPGCTEPAAWCDVHHCIAYLLGGRSDIENFTLLCRKHHRANNDKRDGSDGRGHYERDPITGEVGYRPPDGSPLQFNDTVLRMKAPGRSKRNRGTSREGPAEPRGPDQDRSSA